MIHINDLYQIAKQADEEYQDALYNEIDKVSPLYLKKLEKLKDDAAEQWLIALNSVGESHDIDRLGL